MKVITRVGKKRIVAKSHSEMIARIKGEIVRRHLFVNRNKPKQLEFNF
jgi:hypothetical protein